MSADPPTVLFVTPGASSAGGNVFLARFLRWFKQNSDIPFVTVYGHGGDLEDEFKALSPAYGLDYKFDGVGAVGRTLEKVRRKFRLQERDVVREITKRNVRLIYSNAVTNQDILANFGELSVPVISHCHELESVIHRTGLEKFRQLKQRTTRFIAVSDAVRQNLIANHEVDPDIIDLIYGFIPVSELSIADNIGTRRRIRAELNIPESAFVVGASGTLYWRKAPDLFIQIADEVATLRPDAPIYFLWVGGARVGDIALFEANFDVRKLGLEDRVRFLEHKSNPMDYYAAMDAFALVSREDPFPLVCLETALLGKPIICFADAGGMPEFVAGDCGHVVPYLDLRAFGERVIELYEDPDAARRMGAAAAEKVRRDHDVSVGGPKIVELIRQHLNPGAS